MFYTHPPVQLLIGDEIEAHDLNESSLGTALDAIYDAGITELFFHVGSQVFARYGIPGWSRHAYDVALLASGADPLDRTGTMHSEHDTPDEDAPRRGRSQHTSNTT